MIQEITARVLLSSVKQPDPWFGLKYNLNLYRGCQHQCIYCDSRSERYQIENFSDILIKVNAIDLLRDELPRKRIKGTIGTGSMNDPYMPIEAERNLSGRALQVIAEQHFPVHILTKSDLVLRDLELLKDISRVYAAVSFTITTAEDELGKKVEPGAALVSRRFKAIEAIATQGVLTGVTMMPILPFLEDNAENITAIVQRSQAAGARYIIPWFGMSLRDRQRSYYYAQLERLFPGLPDRYERQYGNQYTCPIPEIKRLEMVFREACDRLGMPTKMPVYVPTPIGKPPPLQMHLDLG
jgi:DNA repair photolyase